MAVYNSNQVSLLCFSNGHSGGEVHGDIGIFADVHLHNMGDP